MSNCISRSADRAQLLIPEIRRLRESALLISNFETRAAASDARSLSLYHTAPDEMMLAKFAGGPNVHEQVPTGIFVQQNEGPSRSVPRLRWRVGSRLASIFRCYQIRMRGAPRFDPTGASMSCFPPPFQLLLSHELVVPAFRGSLCHFCRSYRQRSRCLSLRGPWGYRRL